MKAGMNAWQASLLVPAIFMLACSEQTGASRNDEQIVSGEPDALTGRWYSVAEVDAGKQVFQQHCASCHGREAQGLVEDWQQRQPDGSLPPPPLNGSAHAWHHPLSMLLQVINQGGAPYGGNMPAFAERLFVAEKRAAIAFFQSFWDQDTYQQWLQMGGTN